MSLKEPGHREGRRGSRRKDKEKQKRMRMETKKSELRIQSSAGRKARPGLPAMLSLTKGAALGKSSSWAQLHC